MQRLREAAKTKMLLEKEAGQKFNRRADGKWVFVPTLVSTSRTELRQRQQLAIEGGSEASGRPLAIENAAEAQVEVCSSGSEARSQKSITPENVAEIILQPEEEGIGQIARSQLERVDLDLAVLLSWVNISDVALAESIRKAEVVFASGESDEDSIRDFESGGARTR